MDDRIDSNKFTDGYFSLNIKARGWQQGVFNILNAIIPWTSWCT